LPGKVRHSAEDIPLEVKHLEEQAGSGQPITFALNRSFGFFWLGQTISTLGSQVTAFAIPLMAAISLHASPQQMGYLKGAEFFPFLLFTLPAGVWADLGIRRWMMMVTNLAQGSVILLVPLMVWLGWMRLEVLYLVMFGMGSLKVIFEMSYQTYVPELVGRERLVSANSKIMMSYALGQSCGPGLAGILVEFLGASLAVFADSFGFFICALCVFQIKHHEVRQAPQPLLPQIIAGFRYVGRQPHVRSLLCLLSASNFFMNALMTLLVLYATRILNIRPGVFGVIVSVGGLGAITGASIAQTIGKRLGPGPFMIACVGVCGLAALIFPAVRSGQQIGLSFLALAYFLLSASGSAITVYAWTIRQFLTPPELLGKMNGAFRFCVTGVMPFGAFFGGLMGERIGVRPTLVFLGFGLLLAATACWLFTPLRTLKNLLPVSGRRAV
jgi:MFS family permease